MSCRAGNDPFSDCDCGDCRIHFPHRFKERTEHMENAFLRISVPTERPPHRQFCQMCHAACVVEFLVETPIWELALHSQWWNSPLCINCFARNADEKLIDWAKHTTFLGFYSLAGVPREAAAADEIKGSDIDILEVECIDHIKECTKSFDNIFPDRTSVRLTLEKIGQMGFLRVKR